MLNSLSIKLRNIAMMNKTGTSQLNKSRQKPACGKAEGDLATFLYSLLHGLNNPLTILLNTSRELDSMLSLERIDKILLRQHIEEIVDSSEEIESLSRNVLLSSQILDRQGQAHLERIPVADIFCSLRLANQGKAARKRQQLVFKDPFPESLLLSDRFFLVTILGNLLDNAIKYSGFDTRIEVEWRAVDLHQGSIVVSDQGPGISEKDRDKLFTRFARLPARPTGGERSQGLGLFVARSLAVLNGGNLSLLASDCGSRFELRLPLCLPDKSRNPISVSS